LKTSKVLAIVIPAYDEEATIAAMLRRVRAVDVEGCELRIIVVDDGSADRTAKLAERGGAEVVRHPENRGLGAAVRTGLRAAVEARAEAVAYLDADLEYSPEDIPEVVEPILAGRADYVLGSRFAGSTFAGPEGMRLHRKVGNYVFTALVSLLTGEGISDGQTGMRAFSREAAVRAEIIHDYNYAQVLTLDLLRKGFRVEEVPVHYRVREHGVSFINWRYPAKVLPAIWRELRGP